MLEKLTDDQVRLMEKVKNEYLGLLEKKINEQDAKEGVKFVYKLTGLEEPKILILDSPLACQFACNLMKISNEQQVRQQVEQQVRQQVNEQVRQKVRQKVWQQVEQQVNEQVRQKVEQQVWQQVGQQVWQQVGQQVYQQVYQQVGQQVGQQVRQQVYQRVYQQVGQQVEQQVENQVRQKVENQVWQQVENQVRQQVRQQIEHQKMEYYNPSYDGIWIYDWISFYDYFQRIGIVNDKLFDQYKKYIRSGAFSSIYFDKLAILSKNAILILRDDKGRLHNQEGYAIEWVDGYGQNYVHGVYFEDKLFDRIFIEKEITGEEILKLKNTEQKAVAIQFFGYDKMIKELGVVKIDSYRVYNTYTGRESVSELYEFDLDGVKIRFVKVQDHSTGKITTLGVPVEDGTETVKGAIAWTFGLKEDEYCLVKET